MSVNQAVQGLKNLLRAIGNFVSGGKAAVHNDIGIIAAGQKEVYLFFFALGGNLNIVHMDVGLFLIPFGKVIFI